MANVLQASGIALMFGRIALKTGPRYRDIPKPARVPVALPPITERRFQQQIEDLAHLHGWKTYHTWNSMHSVGGFPDLVLVRGNRLIFAELKSERGKLKPDQEDWLEALSYTGAEVFEWRPSDFSEITRVLR